MAVYQFSVGEADAQWAMLGSAIKIAQNIGMSKLDDESTNTKWPAAWRDPHLHKSIVDGVQQVFGYMVKNDLRYSLLTTGEQWVFMQRDGHSLQVADVQRTSKEPSPMAGIYYLMKR